MRKHKLPDELAELSRDELAEVNLWLSKYTYRKTGELIAARHGKYINENKLCRYYQRLREVEELNQSSVQSLSVPDLVALKNGDPLPDPNVNEQLLQAQCFRLAHSPHLTVEKLTQLFHITTYSRRRSLTERRLQLEDRRNALRDQKNQLRDQQKGQ